MACVLRIDHGGVAVRGQHQALARYQALFGVERILLTDLTMNGARLQAAYLGIGDGLVVLDGVASPSASWRASSRSAAKASTMSRSSPT